MKLSKLTMRYVCTVLALTLVFNMGAFPAATLSAHATEPFAAGTIASTEEPATYDIIYKLNGGKQAKQQVTTLKQGQSLKASKLKNPTRARYKFLGWYSNRALTKKANTIHGVASPAKRTVYAKWKLKSYNIIYSMNGGVFKGTHTKTIGKNKTLKVGKVGKPKRNGYTFSGWYTDKKLKTKATIVQGVSKASKRTLYAKWTTKKYSISYKLNGGTLPSNYATSYKTSKGCSLPTPKRSGFSFLGWYSDPALTKHVYSIPVDDYGNKTLYAKWTKRIAVAHRGYFADGAAENSIGAYEAAAAKGFTYVETDIRFTRDNQAVLSHDDNLKIYVNDQNGNTSGETGKLTIATVTLSELQNNYTAVNPSGSEIAADSETGTSGLVTTQVEDAETSAADEQTTKTATIPTDESTAESPTNPTGEPLESIEPNNEQPETPQEQDKQAATTPKYRNITEFGEFLDTCKNHNLIPIIELKEGTEAQIESLVAEVDKRNMTNSVHWASFQVALLQYVQAVHPNSTFVLLGKTASSAKIRNVQLLAAKGGDASIGSQASQLTEAQITKCQKAGIAQGIWTIDNETKIPRYPQFISSFTLNGLVADRVPEVI